MSLHIAAQNMASKGRGPDNTLVHMSRDEVKSLNDLAMAHGGHLTTNPDTGLPEAGFLSSILPMVAGAAITAATGGAAAPWMIGLGMGGLETLRTGSLQKGLMAGLGAYGGAGLGAGLMGAGEAALTEAATVPGGGISGTAATAGYDQALASGTPLSEASSLNSMASTTPVAPSGNYPMAQAVPQMQPVPTAAVEGTYTPSSLDAVKYGNPTGLDKMQTGLQGLGSESGRAAFMDKMGGGSGLFKAGMAAASPVLAGMGANQAGYKGTGPNPYEYSYDPRSGSYTRQATGYRDAQMVTPPRMMAMGGLTAFARGGRSDLGDYSDGGRMLRGPGDGVSDSIPATIGGKRPARLADGEFVVPARIVSEIGNGSSEAGARKLYAMMDRVQGARKKSIGKNKVAVNSRADKMLPA
jgi:hypothetical protein